MQETSIQIVNHVRIIVEETETSVRYIVYCNYVLVITIETFVYVGHRKKTVYFPPSFPFFTVSQTMLPCNFCNWMGPLLP